MASILTNPNATYQNIEKAIKELGKVLFVHRDDCGDEYEKGYLIAAVEVKNGVRLYAEEVHDDYTVELGTFILCSNEKEAKEHLKDVLFLLDFQLKNSIDTDFMHILIIFWLGEVTRLEHGIIPEEVETLFINDCGQATRDKVKAMWDKFADKKDARIKLDFAQIMLSVYEYYEEEKAALGQWVAS